MAGGRVGLDGIHGATMSSITLNEQVPNTMVQIGDPYTQKKLMDFIIEARDLNLFTSITDNGAGGLSSSVGEMAEKTNGAKIDLAQVPLKYPGLKPWEILVSESQERMTLAVSKNKWKAISDLAKRRGVEISHIGEFTNSGHFEIYHQETCVGFLDLNFLHNGLSPMKLEAKWDGKKLLKPTYKKNDKVIKDLPKTHLEILKTLMSDRTIASKEPFIRQYDHEVQAATIVKPFEGMKQTAPNDGGVILLEPHGGTIGKALAISSGLCPQFSHLDTKLMAQMSVDECYRQLISLGANPEKIAMTDNFCWPDPLQSKNNPDYSHKLAQLVRAGLGLKEASLAYEAPMISGKDSMKNDFVDEEIKISVPPTLLVTGMGYVEELGDIKKSSIKKSGLLVYLIGPKFSSNYFGHYLSKYFDIESNNDFSWSLPESFNFYRLISKSRNLISSMHDVSEGGLLVTLSEKLFLNKLGCKIENKKLTTENFYSEYPSQFVVSIDADKRSDFEKVFSEFSTYIGTTIDQYEIQIEQEQINLQEVEKAWRVSWE
jgi:phosphoribosylformylglycinamidine synthase